MIGGEAGRHLGTLGSGATPGDQDINVPGGLTQPVECRLVGAHLIGAARVEERDQDVGEHVAGEDASARRSVPRKFTLERNMRSYRAAALASALAWLALVACEGTGAPSVPPSQIGLQQGDLPAMLTRCPASGSIGAFLGTPKPNRQPAHDELLSAWQDLQRHGATQAAVAVYAAQQPACAARVGAGDGESVTSLVVEFHDDAAARAAYQRGVLGFTTPDQDAEVAGMNRGAATGFGRNSWVLQRSVDGRALTVGLWERNAVLVLVVAVDADPLNTQRALSAVDGRIP
jgi:hypothetical protein